MRNEKKISYITYQTFPAETANSLQTISNIKYLSRNGFNVELVFPLRSINSSNDLNIIRDFYKFDEDIKIRGTKHNLPFGKFKYLDRILFLISHFIWTRNIVKTLLKESEQPESYFTRSDWAFYFLSKKSAPVVYECHQYTKIRKMIINSALKSARSKIIFLNKNLKDDYESKYNLKNNFIVLHNGVDLDLFQNFKNNENEIIFVGNLKRFKESRNIEFLLSAFKELDKKYILKIIGVKESEIDELNNEINNLKISDRVKILRYLNHKETIDEMCKSGIGVLINSDLNMHSTKYTSPLKYFEYLAANLKIIAVDFDAHKKLPFSENISFFNTLNIETFQTAINNSLKIKSLSKNSLYEISLDLRAKPCECLKVKKIIRFSIEILR